jgi:hypothetical protein
MRPQSTDIVGRAYCRQTWLLLRVALCAVLLAGCPTNQRPATAVSLPIVLASSADFGCCATDTPRLSRIVRLKNVSGRDVRISHWTRSCECLEIHPSSIDVGQGGTAYIELVMEPGKENPAFVGDLMINVDAFDAAERVGTFAATVSIVSPESFLHLKGTARD